MLTEILLTIITLILLLIFILLLKGSNSRYLKRFASNDIKMPSQGSGKKNSTTIKYSKNGLSDAIARDFKYKIQEVMDAESLFLNPNLKLEDLAQTIGLSKNQTSHVINKEFEMDFNSYINSLRVKSAIGILLKEPGKQITEVMYEVGFNNSTTFNRAFKKITGLTPTAFLLQESSQKSLLST